jgi:hypothetical protein
MKRIAPFLLLASFPLWAADFWQSKPFTAWGEKEIQRMLINSPWAHAVSISTQPLSAGRGAPGTGVDVPGNNVPGSNAPGNNNAGIGLPSDTAPRLGEIGGGGSTLPEVESSVPKISVVVRWQTALPVRQAFIRAKYGSEAATSPEAKSSLERQEALYVIAVSEVPAALLRGDAEKLKQSIEAQSTLFAKGKEPLRPSEIQFSEPAELMDVFLIFPKSAASAFSLDDKEVEVSTRIGDAVVKYRFRLKDMVYNGKLEL